MNANDLIHNYSRDPPSPLLAVAVAPAVLVPVLATVVIAPVVAVFFEPVTYMVLVRDVFVFYALASCLYRILEQTFIYSRCRVVAGVVGQ